MHKEKIKGQKKVVLSDLCNDTLMLILQLRATKEFGNANLLRRRITDVLDELERNGKKHGFHSEELQQAKFALVAFIDETIVTSEWSQKESWLNNPLQIELFNRFDAGEEFFQRVDLMRRRIDENVQVLEVFYFCLALGFKGKYQMHGQEKLRLLIDELYSELRLFRGKASNILSPHGNRKEEIVDMVAKGVPAWVIAVTVLVVGFCFYAVMTFFITGAANEVETVISSIK